MRKPAGGVPTRNSIQFATSANPKPVNQAPSAVASAQQLPVPAPVTTPAAAKASHPDGWIPGNDAVPEQSFGTVGVIAATLLITVLVYFGVLKLIQ
jgi:hypothetical protein